MVHSVTRVVKATGVARRGAIKVVISVAGVPIDSESLSIVRSSCCKRTLLRYLHR